MAYIPSPMELHYGLRATGPGAPGPCPLPPPLAKLLLFRCPYKNLLKIASELIEDGVCVAYQVA
jgi:hypothetical protein